MPPKTSDTGPVAALRGARGAGPLGCLFRLALLGAALYVGIRFGAPYLDAWRFQDAMKTQASLAERNADAKIRAALMETAEDLGIPLSPSELRISRTRHGITISARWSTDVVLPKYRRTLHFQRQVSAPLVSQPP
jgi:hypothetical protein